MEVKYSVGSDAFCAVCRRPRSYDPFPSPALHARAPRFVVASETFFFALFLFVFYLREILLRAAIVPGRCDALVLLLFTARFSWRITLSRLCFMR